MLLDAVKTCWIRGLMILLIGGSLAADDRTASDILPETTVLYAELPRPLDLADQLKDHPLRDKLKNVDAIRDALDTPQSRMGLAGLKLVEAQLGMTWHDALSTISRRGLTIAVDTPTEGVALLAHGSDADVLKNLITKVINFARQDAKNKDKKDPFEETSYRDIPVYKIDGGGMAIYEDWLVIVNKGPLGQKLLDNLLDGADKSLAGNTRFQSALARRSPDSNAWGYVDLETLRTAGAAKNVFTGKADDPGGEILIGGILEILQFAEFATGEISLTSDSLSLNLMTPWNPEWVSEAREHYFGSEGTGAAPAVKNIPEPLFTIAAYRNLSEMWLRAGDLFNERINDGFAEADNTLTTLFSGKDFGEEILGAVAPQLQILGVRQTFSPDRPIPAIKLPAFALVAEMNDPAQTRKDFRRIYQSLIGFLNVVGAQNGQPQLELNFQSLEDGELITASYVPEKGKEHDDRAPINFNFSPSVAFSGNLFVLSSSGNLARMLSSADSSRQEGPSTTNTVASLYGSPLKALLEDNQEQLISKNMLEKGQSREEAEAEIGTLLELLGLIQSASLKLENSTDTLNLGFQVRYE